MRSLHVIASSFATCSTLFFLVFLGACGGPDHSERIARVDSLQKELKGYQERLSQLDTSQAIRIQKRSERELELFQEHYEGDSMGQKLYHALDDQKRTQKALKGYKKSLRKLRSGMKKSRSQLKHLKKDLKRGHYSEKEAEEYLRDEGKVLKELKGALKRFEKKTNSALENYKSFSDVVKERVSLPDTVSWPGDN